MPDQPVPKERRKVNELLAIEAEIQKIWESQKPFEVDAPEDDKSTQEKFLITFPFPYMNGRLHAGHTFTLSKAEFSVGFERMKGKRALFPFGFHATGMPIKACADKLAAEIAQFGNPPVFSAETSDEPEEKSEIDEIIKDKSKSKKTKAVAKAGSSKYQWNIMKGLGLSDEEIPKFADDNYWLDYFPGYAIKDLKSMGLKADFRRSFMTTERNLYFDSFIQWQFRKLKSLGLIDFGKRYSIYSPKDGQPCMDHDRASGEGVGPQEYTLIKIKVLSNLPKELEAPGKPVFLVAATLRPETMYGQTNCFIHPDLKYAAFYVGPNNEEVFVSTKRAAINMSYQGFTKEPGKIEYVLQEINGSAFIGAKLKAPLTSYDHVYALPMLTIKDSKGTGVVTSVPSDAPDDLVTLNELKRKQAWREKHGLTDDMVLPFEPIPIIEIPELGKLAAVNVVEQFKIVSPNDKDQLEKAKKEVYLKGFYNGVSVLFSISSSFAFRIMLVGKHKGKKTEEAKKLIQQEMIESNEAVKYMEPEKLVVSRSGEECVVALCDQWYLDYGNPDWKAKAKKVIAHMETFAEETRHNLEYTVDWLHEYACSRLYGLGTKLPWDKRWVIESLSDSTIYTCYYSVAHILQKGSLDGKDTKNGVQDVKPEQLNDDFWDYVMLDGIEYDSSKIRVPKEIAFKCKKEFSYWRAPNVRVSGKDLIQNHLTFYVFNHVAIFGDNQDKWPKGIRANGHLLLDNEKMSKSTGNFLTLSETVEAYSADGMRLALADSGDGVEDANFARNVAETGLLRLYNMIEYVNEALKEQKAGNYRSGEFSSLDRYFSNRLNELGSEAYEAYDKTEYKNALKYAFYEYQTARDTYRELCGGETRMHTDLIKFFLETQVLILSPICPHIAEHIWKLLGKTGLIVNEKWPVFGEVNQGLIKEFDFVITSIHEFRQKQAAALKSKKGPSLPTKGTIYVAAHYPPWQAEILKLLRGLTVDHENFPDMRVVSSLTDGSELLKKNKKKIMPFVSNIKTEFEQSGGSALLDESPVDQLHIIKNFKDYIRQTLNLNVLDLVGIDEVEGLPEHIADKCGPMKPLIVFEA